MQSDCNRSIQILPHSEIPSISSNDKTPYEPFPGDSGLVMRCLVADVLHKGDLSGVLWEASDDDLTVLRAHTLDCEPHARAFAESLGITADEPSWWMTVCLPQLDREIQRRNRPKWTGGGSKIADRKASLDLADVASKYTNLNRRGPNLVGRCPFHQEKTASFTVYPDQHYHCFGCGAHGDVLNLIQRMGGRNA